MGSCFHRVTFGKVMENGEDCEIILLCNQIVIDSSYTSLYTTLCVH